jgi:acetyltransferase-like isoleucine patch superfamily enzyme
MKVNMKNSLRKYYGGLQFIFFRLIGFVPSHSLRKILYRLVGMQIGSRSYIYAGAEIRNPKQIIIGNDTVIGHGAVLDGRRGLRIGNNVNFSSGVWIWTLQHDPQSPGFTSVGAEVVIEDYAWISARAMVLPGVHVARGCVVAAGAIVTKDTTPNSIFAGIPAKKIGDRNPNLVYQLGALGATPFI